MLFMPAARSLWYSVSLAPVGRVHSSRERKLLWTKTEMNPSCGRLQGKRANFSGHLHPGCGSLETKSHRYLYGVLFYSKTFSLMTKHFGSQFLDWSYFKQVRSCTKAVFGSELSGVREVEEFRQCQKGRGSSKQSGQESGIKRLCRGNSHCSEIQKQWYSGVGYSLSLL